MAFRASTKSASKIKTKTKPPKAAEEQVTESAVAPTLSIDELVSAPKEPADTSVIADAPADKKSGDLTEMSQPHVLTPPPRQDRPREGFDRNRGSQSSGRPGYTPGGYRRPMGGNGYPGRTGGYSRPISGGYRREWGRPSPYDNGQGKGPGIPGRPQGESFTQDIDVPTETVRGILDIMPEGHGFLRPKFTPSEKDVYISQSQIRRFLLRNGDMVEGQARHPKDNERYWGLLKVEKVDDKLAEEMESRPKFEDLTPLYPNKHLRLETGLQPLSTRIIDLVAPIGFGQRGLIVSPPKAGKTTILKELAAGVSANYPNVHLMAALIGERPEEVTDLSRSIKGEVLASNFDESPSEQTRIAEVALDRAKRLVEMGKDVVILLDSITRLARAYNLVVNPSGRTLSGGFDPAALYPAKKFLGAARCVEPSTAQTPAEAKAWASAAGKGVTGVTGGSLTVIGTALVETGSRMDDLIYEEFKGTGNMELHLSRSLQERRIFPAIDIGKSGTRHDELLLGEDTMKKVVTLRHMLSLLGDEERTMMLIERLGKTKSNDEFLEGLATG